MSKRKSPTWHPKHWPLHIGLGMLRLLAYLPYSFKYRLGSLIGLMLYWFYRPLRRIALINIKHCFPLLPLKAQKNLAKKSFLSIGQSLMDSVSMVWPKKGELNHLVYQIKGLHYVRETLAAGHGVIILFPHFINIYMVGYLLLRNTDLKFSIMYRVPPNPVLRKLASTRLKQNCQQVFGRKDVKKMISHLRQNNVVWYASDLDPGKKQAVFAPFFGNNAATHTATARIVKASQAKIIPIGFYRRPDKKFEIEFYPPIENFPAAEDVDNARALNKVLEEIISKNPEQYLWQYKRFATQPAGEKSIYES